MILPTICIRTLTLPTLLVEHIISSIRISRITTRPRWKFRICTTPNDLTCIVFPHYTFLWPEDGPQWPKYVVSLIKQIQRLLCFDVYLPPPNIQYTSIFIIGPWVCENKVKVWVIIKHPPNARAYKTYFNFEILWEGGCGEEVVNTKKLFAKKVKFVGLRCDGIRKVASCEREHNFSVRMWVNRLNVYQGKLWSRMSITGR